MYFHYFVIISPWKRAEPFIWTNLNPLHPRMLCAKFGWNWPSSSGEEDENVKIYRQTDGRTDGQTEDGRQVIRKAHLSFQLRWAKKPKKLTEDITIIKAGYVLCNLCWIWTGMILTPLLYQIQQTVCLVFLEAGVYWVSVWAVWLASVSQCHPCPNPTIDNGHLFFKDLKLLNIYLGNPQSVALLK